MAGRLVPGEIWRIEPRRCASVEKIGRYETHLLDLRGFAGRSRVRPQGHSEEREGAQRVGTLVFPLTQCALRSGVLNYPRYEQSTNPTEPSVPLAAVRDHLLQESRKCGCRSAVPLHAPMVVVHHHASPERLLD